MNYDIELIDSHDKEKGLKYKGLSIIFFDIFTLPDKCKIPDYIKRKKLRIDEEIFFHSSSKDEINNVIKRYLLEGFSFDLQIAQPCADPSKCDYDRPCAQNHPFSDKPYCGKNTIFIKGKVHVEMSLFNDQTVSMTYRMVIDNKINKIYRIKNDLGKDHIEFVEMCIGKERDSNVLLNTDQLIALISLYIDNENWSTKVDEKIQRERLRRLNELAQISEKHHGLKPLSELISMLISKEGATEKDIEKKLKGLEVNTELLDSVLLLFESEEIDVTLNLFADIAIAYLNIHSDSNELISELENTKEKRALKDISYGVIDPDNIDDFSFYNFPVDAKGNWCNTNRINSKDDAILNDLSSPKLFREALERYKKYIFNICNHKPDSANDFESSKYVYVDIWETLQHEEYDEYFDSISEQEIISHIRDHHKNEIMGLMSLYPSSEWVYRDSVDFEDVCGKTISIDTDDLVLANQKMCVVFGTYGKRGDEQNAVNWVSHLRVRAAFHASWPEYFVILELLLIKKHILRVTVEIVINEAYAKDSNADPLAAMENNAKLHLKVLHTITGLDIIKHMKFVAHRIMHDRTNKILGVEEERDKLEKMQKNVDTSLASIRDSQAMKRGEEAKKRDEESLKKSSRLGAMLSFVSLGTLVQIILLSNEAHRLTVMGLRANEGRIAASVLIAASETLLLVLLGFIIWYHRETIFSLRWIKGLFKKKHNK